MTMRKMNPNILIIIEARKILLNWYRSLDFAARSANTNSAIVKQTKKMIMIHDARVAFGSPLIVQCTKPKDKSVTINILVTK